MTGSAAGASRTTRRGSLVCRVSGTEDESTERGSHDHRASPDGVPDVRRIGALTLALLGVLHCETSRLEGDDHGDGQQGRGQQAAYAHLPCGHDRGPLLAGHGCSRRASGSRTRPTASKARKAYSLEDEAEAPLAGRDGIPTAAPTR